MNCAGKWLLFVSVSLSVVTASCGAVDDPGLLFDDPTVVSLHEVHRIQQPPVIDGVLDEPWKIIPEEKQLYHFGPMFPVPARINTTMRLAYDDAAFYLYVRCEAKHMDKLVAKRTQRDDPSAWEDDCLEIYFDPANTGVGFYKFIVTAGSALVDMNVLDGQRVDYGWSPGNWRAVPRRDDKGWSVEMRLPWSDLGCKPSEGDLWSFALLRFSFASEGAGTCSAVGASYHNRGNFGYLYFGTGAAKRLRDLAGAVCITKGKEWMMLSQDGLVLYERGDLAVTPYAKWVGEALQAASRRVGEAKAELAACRDPKLVEARRKPMENAEAAMQRATGAWQAAPKAPIEMAGVRSEAKEAFLAADETIWAVKARELLLTYSPGEKPEAGP